MAEFETKLRAINSYLVRAFAKSELQGPEEDFQSSEYRWAIKTKKRRQIIAFTHEYLSDNKKVRFWNC